MVSPRADLYRIPLTFEKGLFEGQEKSVLPPGYTSLQENWISEPTGGLRCRRSWLSTPTTGAPTTRKCRGIGQFVQPTNYATPSATPLQSKAATGANVSTLAATAFTNPTTLGNFLVFAVQWSNPGTRTVSTPPSGYTLVGTSVVGTGVSEALYIKANCGANESAPSITLSGAAYIKVITAEWDKVSAVSPLDVEGNATGSGTAPATASLTTSQTSELKLGLIGSDVGNTSQGPNSGSTFADDATVGTKVWTNVANAASSNDVWAVTSGLANNGDISHYLKATGFGFNIPVGATILGIVAEAEVSKDASSGNIVDSTVRIVKGGTIGATDKSNATAWTTTDTYLSHGGSADLWGDTWSYSDINATNFGVAISCKATLSAAAQGRIDHIRITVYYSVPTVSLTAPTNGYSIVAEIDGDTTSGAFALTAKAVTALSTEATGMTLSISTNWAAKHATFKAASLLGTVGYYLVAHNDSTGSQYGIYSIDRSNLVGGSYSLVENVAVSNPTQLVAFAMGLGNAFWSATNFTTIRRWDGTTAAAVAGSPAGRCLAFHKNRMFAGGTTANPTRLWYSDIGSYSSWPTTSYIDVGQDDGEAIEDIAPFQNGLVIAKATSLFFLSGAGPDSFILQRLNVGSSAPGRTIMPTPYGCVVAGKTAVWLIGNGGAVDLISKPIENTYAVTGPFITCSFIHETVYICDEGSGTSWAWHAPSGAWRQEKVSVAAEAPAVIFNQDDRQLLGPQAATVGSLLSYRLHPSGARGRDAGIGETFKANTAELWVGEADRPVTPTHLWLRVRQRGGAASESPSADLVVTPVYDGVAKTAVRLAPQNGAPLTFTKRLDVGSTKGVRSVEFQVQKVHTSAQSSLMDIEGAALYCIVEKAK